MKERQIGLRIEESTLAQIETLAREERRGRSDMLRVLIEDGLAARTSQDIPETAKARRVTA